MFHHVSSCFYCFIVQSTVTPFNSMFIRIVALSLTQTTKHGRTGAAASNKHAPSSCAAWGAQVFSWHMPCPTSFEFIHELHISNSTPPKKRQHGTPTHTDIVYVRRSKHGIDSAVISLGDVPYPFTQWELTFAKDDET